MPLEGARSVDGKAVPGWITSVILHALLLLACGMGLRSCRPELGEGPGEMREVGLYVRPEIQAAAAAEVTPQPPSRPAQPAATTAADAPADSLLDPLLSLPRPPGPAILGPGARSPQSPLSDPGAVLPRNAASSGNPLAGLTQGETRFMGIKDKGTRFVYVLDRSASMHDHRALEVAKAELITSLQHLDETQQFQVIFYNDATPRLLALANRPQQVYLATESNKTRARDLIRGVTADGGTRHYPALLKALSLEPEVIYFLTDADVFTKLSPMELDTLTRRNKGRCRIHTIKFGKGVELIRNHDVKRLATRNGGRYRYRDIQKFTRP